MAVKDGTLNFLPTRQRKLVIRRYEKLLKIINRYEKSLKPRASGQSSNTEVKAPTQQKPRLTSLRKEKPRKQTAGKKNSKVYWQLKPVMRLDSGGKGRPSRRKHVQWVKVKVTHHLRGNQYSGGQERF